MYIIDDSFFKGEYYVANLSELNSDVKAELERYIDKNCRTVMRYALGDEFAGFDSALTSNKLSVDDAADVKYKNLFNGETYTYNNQAFRWQGLTYTDGVFKGSLLLDYVYYFWLLDKTSFVSSTGEKIVESNYSKVFDSDRRKVTCYNNFLDAYQKMFVSENIAIYEVQGVPIFDYFGTKKSYFVSLIQYLEHKKDIFPNSSRIIISDNYINQLGL